MEERSRKIRDWRKWRERERERKANPRAKSFHSKRKMEETSATFEVFHDSIKRAHNEIGWLSRCRSFVFAILSVSAAGSETRK